MEPIRYSAPLSAEEAQSFLPFLQELIATARGVILPLFLSGTEVITKGDATPVTAADRGAEAAMRALIEARFPEHGILGEEFGIKEAAPGSVRYRWVLDPVDGTRAFITNCFLFGTLIALERDEGQGWRPVAGAIAHPAAGVHLIGHRGGTTLTMADGTHRPVRVRACQRLEDATVLFTTHWSTTEQNGGPALQRLIDVAKLYRTWGDCFGYFSLATGGADLMLDPVLSYWDVAALVPVIEGAGGVITSTSGGNPLTELSALATAGGIHAEALALIAS